jgi:hypothetical protein
VTAAALAIHSQLSELNRARFTPRLEDPEWEVALEREHVARLVEGRFVEEERARVASRAAEAPPGAEAFLGWFEDLARTGPGQGDPLFPWLATTATRDELRWFLEQEISGEAGFDDLVALTQVRLPTRAKLELARNYWDEMGQGHEGGMHGPMLERLGHELGLDAGAETVWEPQALANLMCALASSRRYTYQSIGALGAIELTAPGRAEYVNAGLKRLGIRGEARRYFALHAVLDLKHAAAWNREVIMPLIDAEPRAAAPLAEGALMRLEAGARCFARYRAVLGVAS